MYITGEYFFRGGEMMARDDKAEKEDDDFTALPEVTESVLDKRALEESSRQRQEFIRRHMWVIRGGKGAREMRGWRE